MGWELFLALDLFLRFTYNLLSNLKTLLFGDVAHLGERLNGIQEVVGSIPIISTKILATYIIRVAFSCSKRALLLEYPQHQYSKIPHLRNIILASETES